MNVHCTCVYHILLILINNSVNNYNFFLSVSGIKQSLLTFYLLTSTAWSSFSHPCPYAVSMSMQWVRFSLYHEIKYYLSDSSNLNIKICNSDCNRLTLACLWNTWCTAWTFSLSKTWCTTLHGALIRKCHISEFSLILYVNDIYWVLRIIMGMKWYC